LNVATREEVDRARAAARERQVRYGIRKSMAARERHRWLLLAGP